MENGCILNTKGLLLEPVKSFWDLAGSCSDEATFEEVNVELDKLRHQTNNVNVRSANVGGIGQKNSEPLQTPNGKAQPANATNPKSKPKPSMQLHSYILTH